MCASPFVRASLQMMKWSRISLLLAEFFRQSAQSFFHMIAGIWLKVSKFSDHLGDSVAAIVDDGRYRIRVKCASSK